MKDSPTSLAVLLKVGLAAFGLAALGVALGFVGWYAVDSPSLAKIGFLLTVVGVGVGFIAIVVGQVAHGRKAVTGSADAMKDLRQKLKDRL